MRLWELIRRKVSDVDKCTYCGQQICESFKGSRAWALEMMREGHRVSHPNIESLFGQINSQYLFMDENKEIRLKRPGWGPSYSNVTEFLKATSRELEGWYVLPKPKSWFWALGELDKAKPNQPVRVKNINTGVIIVGIRQAYSGVVWIKAPDEWLNFLTPDSFRGENWILLEPSNGSS